MPTKKASPQRKPRHQENASFQAALGDYAAAMELFTRQDWPKAKDAFQHFLHKHGENREFTDFADRARTHLRACDGKLSPPAPTPSGAQEWLIAGVALANQGRADEALVALDRALLEGAPEARTRYARAAALAGADRNEEALVDLARAIEVEPSIRFQSLLDPDFERLRETAGYVALVEPPRELPPISLDAEDLHEDFEDAEEAEDDFDAFPDAEGPIIEPEPGE